MKKYVIIIALGGLVAVLALGVTAEAAPTIDETASVSATATIAGTTSLSISPASIVFGTTNVNAFPTTPADGKVTITYTSNYNPWKIAIYTDNTQVPMKADGGRYQKAGLATADGANVVACKWVAKDPASPAPDISTIGGYNFVKDKRDEDDPATVDDPLLPGIQNDESWITSFAQGYPNIAYGGAGYGTCVDPTLPDYTGDSVNGEIVVYIASLFGTYPGGAGEYSTNFSFDLYHE